MKKYNITEESMTYKGCVLWRIQHIATQEKGGWIQEEQNLSQEGGAWIAEEAKVYGEACVSDDACISGNAEIFGSAQIRETGQVYGEAKGL
ncbi:carbonic anhydrase/acetyltransferase-like protein (isoleucine patch superfamily) [Myroides gitamensis]|nr:carbonic anhydrase/acetyltransferase-like protein (isoleucine patch superfamily) [Myroides gitamensis]